MDTVRGEVRLCRWCDPRRPGRPSSPRRSRAGP